MLAKTKKIIYDTFVKSLDLKVSQFSLYLYNDGPNRLIKGNNGLYTLTANGVTIVEFDNMEYGNYQLEIYKNNRIVAIL